MTKQEIYGDLHWHVNVQKYYQIGKNCNGNRWRMSFDDTYIADFDHNPTMNECMDALINWWASPSP